MDSELKEFTDDDKNQEDYVLYVRFTVCLRMNLRLRFPNFGGYIL